MARVADRTTRANDGRGFALATRETEGAVVLVAKGEFDMAATDVFVEAAREVALGSQQLVVVDLADVTFLDSSGISCLVDLHHELQDGRRRLVLTNLSNVIRRPIEVLKLDQVLDIDSG